MTPKQKIKASKFLCLILRHKPEVGGIVVDSEGWANSQSVLRALQDNFAGMTNTILQEIVAEDEKQRYSFSPHMANIRANQGHSLPVELGLVEIEPPEFLFHGTAKKTVWMIRRDGLLPMDRQYVHLSETEETAIKVGKRHGEPVVLIVRAWEMYALGGLSFFRSENGVWMSQAVPSDYLIFRELSDDEQETDHPYVLSQRG